MVPRSQSSRLFALAAPALVVACAAGLLVAGARAQGRSGDGRGLASFGDRGLTTFGDRFTESFGNRPLESIGPIPLSSMGGLDTSRPSRKVEAHGGPATRRPAAPRQRRLSLDVRDDARSLRRGPGERSVATLRGAVVASCDPANRFVLPPLALPPLLLDHARAEQELSAALRDAAAGARERGDLAAADVLQTTVRR